MNFRPRQKEEPEINLIPFIDVLLVVLIFLMLSTTYSKFTELQLQAAGGRRRRAARLSQGSDRRREQRRQVRHQGRAGGRAAASRRSRCALSEAAKAGKDSVVIISADAAAPHQSVITVMEAARRSGLIADHLRHAVLGPGRKALTMALGAGTAARLAATRPAGLRCCGRCRCVFGALAGLRRARLPHRPAAAAAPCACR